ncbi:MAG: phenylalanine--tRNA ligase subunit beta [Bacteroidales bacterium]|nr:phenylalanine--tRNA ligase subunit beta [Bacteroidales bacterium]MCF8332722.1 phenylalanine--tRNA ligase subunit beta [Bacteroidales bacterium]
MKISYNWLRDYIKTNKSPEEVGDWLTNSGLEVEGLDKVESVKGGLEGVVVGEVLTCEKHPNAEKLSVTTVDVGKEEPAKIVCGAPNVDKGQKVPVALVGTTLYPNEKPIEIKKAKIRGEASEGMICAEDELGLGSSHEGIMVLDPEAPIGKPAKDYFNIEEDYVFEIGLTPNRTDAMAHIGVAKDLAAVLNNFGKEEEKYKVDIPDISGFAIDDQSLPIEVQIEDDKACPRYSGITVSDVKVSESPDWLKNKLNTIGVRPINILVDISNYVLFETGQPLHFFDADAINGNRVVIKKQEAGTKFTTLDEVERELSSEDLMICNEQEPMCMAGVFGGISSGVTGKTERVFIESAYFDPPTIRKTSKRHGLQTDASFRFERGADPSITIYALKRAALLIKKLAGGRISSPIVDEYPREISPKKVEVDYRHMDGIIGEKIDRKKIRNILNDLEIKVLQETEQGLRLEVPTNRADVTREADIIEEILRIYGYNNIEFEEQLATSLSYISQPEPDKVRNVVSDYLSSNGFFEIMNNSLTKADYTNYTQDFEEKNNVIILNPLSNELNAMRQTMVFGGLESINYNINRRQNSLQLFEFGYVYQKEGDRAQAKKDPLDRYHEKQLLALFITGTRAPESWQGAPVSVDFFDLKRDIFNIFLRLGFDITQFKLLPSESDIYLEGLDVRYQKKKIASMGRVNKNLLKKMDISQDVFYGVIEWDIVFDRLSQHRITYQPMSKFPEVRRDLALLLDERVTFHELEQTAFQYGGDYLREVNLFDIYRGENIAEGKKSYALSFILQREDRTLKDKDIDKIMNKIIKGFEKQVAAEIRK